MGIIKSNAIATGFSGKLGDDLVFKQIGTRTFFSRKGVNTKTPTPAQRANRNVFAEAQAMASILLEDPDHREWYTIVAHVNGLKSAQLAAVKDCMLKPEIESVNLNSYRGHAGDVMLIKPKVLLKVRKITVTLYDGDGALVESGLAIKQDFNWTYRTTHDNPNTSGSRVVLEAYDRLDKSCKKIVYVE